MRPREAIALSSLSPGDGALVVDVRGEGAFRRRLLDMGFVSGTFVRVVKRAPLADPIEYCIGGTHITLRKREAEQILVHPHESSICRDESAGGTRGRRDGSGPRDGRGPHPKHGSGQGRSGSRFWNRFRRRGEVKRDD